MQPSETWNEPTWVNTRRQGSMPLALAAARKLLSASGSKRNSQSTDLGTAERMAAHVRQVSGSSLTCVQKQQRA